MGLGDRIQFTDGDGNPFEVELVGAFKNQCYKAPFIKEKFPNKFKQREDTVASWQPVK